MLTATIEDRARGSEAAGVDAADGVRFWRGMTTTGRAAVAGAMVVLVTVAVVGQALPQGSASRWVAIDVVIGLVALLALPTLPRGSVGATLSVVALSAISPAATPVAATATLWLARWRALGTAVNVGAAGVLALLIRGLWRPTPGIDLGWWLVLVVAVHAALVGWGAAWQKHHALLTSLVERARRAEAEQAARVAEGRKAERDRIAREMHDVLAHRLSLLSTYAGALEFRPDSTVEQVRDAAGVIRVAAHQALEDLRDVIGVLREDGDGDLAPRHPVATLSDLPALVEEGREAGTTIRLLDRLHDGARAKVPPVVGRTTYRIVQESLTNARKHAPGAPVDVELSGHPGDRLEVSVTNGTPTHPVTGPSPPDSGNGLIGLEERVHLTGGTLHHGPTDDGGFQVRASLGWPS